MLIMLDAIHDRYNNQDCNELYKKLDNIQFYVKSLGYFNLSEELYIKMNARGLQLSPFENFKADLINFINNNEYTPYKEVVPLYKKDSDDKVGFDFNFSVKLDAKWIDIFWKKGDENFDAAYMSFFSRFFACKYIVSTKDIVSDREMRQDKTIRQLYTDAESRNDTNEYLGFQEFEGLLSKHPEYVMILDKVFDVFYEYDHKDAKRFIYKSMLPSWEKKNPEDGDDFYRNLSSKMTHSKLILLGAVIEFIEAYDIFDINVFKQWMRVVWNVVENTNIDSLTPVSSLIRKLSAVIRNTAIRSSGGLSFYAALSQWKDDNNDERENRALLEEIEKAKRISENNDWLNMFIQAEEHPFFKGMVLFFLPNIPTEEVFTAPHKDKVDGIVYGTKPYVFNGQLIKGFHVTFKDGKVVEHGAEEGADLLGRLLDTDEGARHIGEVALVPASSPINRSGALFYSTLFDENAACHIAFGASYPGTTEGGTGLTKEQLEERGMNQSTIHEDVMIGAEDSHITGKCRDGRVVELFRNGVWVL